MKNPECTSDAPPISQVEAGEWVCTICNNIKIANLEDVNHSYYIEKTENIIREIQGIKSNLYINPAQLSLF